MRSRRKLIVTGLVTVVATCGLLGVMGRTDGGRTVGRGDCSFLERPEEFLEAQVARREQLQAMTYQVSSKLAARRGVEAAPTPRNFIDNFIFDKMQRDGVAPAGLSTDTEFLRRVYLDLTGRIPSSNDVRAFLENSSPDRRNQVIENLLGSPEFVDRWTMFYGDLFKNVVQNVNINRQAQGRNAFYYYLRDSIAANKPYHQIAGELLVAGGNSFENGPVNYLLGYRQAMGPSQDWYDMMWTETATQFLGIQYYDCLACHDGRGHLDQLSVSGSRGTRMDAWKYAAFFSRVNIGQQAGAAPQPFLVTERPNGAYTLNTNSGNRTPRQPVNGVNTVQPEYVALGRRATNNFREALSDFITQDPQFARAAVNYIWAELMGMGIVDPPDSFDPARLNPNNPPAEPWSLQPSHPELLDALAQEFIRSGYNIQHIIRLIVQSSAYQLSARYDGEWQDTYTPYFARHLVRRLDAEEIHDAIVKATGIPTSYAVTGMTDRVAWAMQLPDTNEQENGVALLRFFTRGNRDNRKRSSESSILQALTMMNDNFVITRVRASAANSTTPNLTRRLLNSGWTNKGMVDEAFLTILGRYPSPREELAAVEHFNGRDRTQALENLVWSLMNKVDFLFNY